MKDKTPIIKISPDIEVMDPQKFEEPAMYIVVDRDGEPSRFCAHEEIRVYPHHRLIQCRHCQATLDPFDYIFHAGQATQNFLSNMKYVKIQMDRLRKENEELVKAIKLMKKNQRK